MILTIQDRHIIHMSLLTRKDKLTELSNITNSFLPEEFIQREHIRYQEELKEIDNLIARLYSSNNHNSI